MTQFDTAAFDINPGRWVHDQDFAQGRFETFAEISVSVRALIFVAELISQRPPRKPHWPVVEAVKAMCEPDVNIQRQR